MPSSSITRSGPGSTWGSSTPASLKSTRRFPKDLLERVEDVILNRRPDATDRLTEFSESVKTKGKKATGPDLSWRIRTRREAARTCPD